MQKPIAIFRHAASEGPGYLATFLDEQQIPWQLFAIDAGDQIPSSALAFSGLAFMGGPMSVNDDLPWIPQSLHLIRDAVQNDIPVLGHCLGGQLMSKALGGVVSRNPVKEIGWGDVEVLGSEAGAWFGADLPTFNAFHWHGETFSIPPAASRILESAHCDNQAFLLGKSIGFQCHIEMTEAMIQEWCEIGHQEIEAAISSPGVQSVETIHAHITEKTLELQRVAKTVYSQWIKGLAR